MERYPSRRNENNIWLGFFFLVIGGALLLRQLNLPLPFWLFSWKTLLITIGLFIGFRSGFQRPTWVIPVIIGSIFLAEDIVPWLHWHQYGWPLALIAVGCIIIFRPRRKQADWRTRKNYETVAAEETKFASENYVDHVAVFGSVKKTIYSKNFEGGELVCVFGGAELNMIQADFTGKIILDVSAVFGGAKLIVPSNWEIKSEVSAVFGGIDDKRPRANTDPGKILVIRGSAFFGGIEINSY